MFIDARTLPDGTSLETDVCIVGGGAAGITLAKEFMGSGLSVILLESGDIGYEEKTQSLYAGPNLGFPAWDLDRARIRALGGSTNHWAGNCMPLEALDFEERKGIPYSGWPIKRSDIDPYYLRAQKLVETPFDAFYDTDENFTRLGFSALETNAEKLRTILYAESPPTNFGFVYEDDLAAAKDVTVYLNANVLEIDCNDTASAVTGLPVACIDGPNFRVEAKRYILAAGGIEIPRLLLLSNRVATAGLGNEHDLVGRFFMDHFSLRPTLTVLLPDGDAGLRLYSEGHEVPGGMLRGALAANQALVRDEEIGNFVFFTFVSANRSPGERSSRTLWREAKNGSSPSNLLGHIGNVITDLDGFTNEAYKTATGSEDSLIERSWLDPWIAVENLPNPESRVKLVDERDDVFGQRRIGLDWRLSSEDLRTTRRAAEILAEELGRLGYGRVWSEILQNPSEWPYVAHGKHHCGTTKMSADPKRGVVDANCRVHGMSNLYIASSSVFPTHGYATPTLTIVALAVRLADHIRAEADGGAL